MVVNELMKCIWIERKQQYEKTLDYARALSSADLYALVKNNRMPFYTYPITNMNLLSCAMCSYRLKKQFGGCSMCDYEDDLTSKVYMSVLREKNIHLFTQAVVDNFINTRGKNCHPGIFELISMYLAMKNFQKNCFMSYS